MGGRGALVIPQFGYDFGERFGDAAAERRFPNRQIYAAEVSAKKKDGLPNMKRNRSIRRSAGLIAAAVLACFGLRVNSATARAQQPPPAAPPKVKDMIGQPASKFYKNLKVLKDVPANRDSSRDGIHHHRARRGLRLLPRHSESSTADDKPTKRSARNMMQMMFALDNTVFAGKREVTCYTCHRGSPVAATSLLLPGEKGPTQAPNPNMFANIAVPNITLYSNMAPVRPTPAELTAMAPPPNPNAPKPAPVALPSVDEVFAKYQQSLGGSAAVMKASTLTAKGTVEMPGAEPSRRAGSAAARPPGGGNLPQGAGQSRANHSNAQWSQHAGLRRVGGLAGGSGWT